MYYKSPSTHANSGVSEEEQIIAKIKIYTLENQRYSSLRGLVPFEKLRHLCDEDTIQNLEVLMNQGLGKRSPHFVRYMVEKVSSNAAIGLWVRVEDYLLSVQANDPNIEQKESVIKEVLEAYKNIRTRSDGRGYVHDNIQHPILVKVVYLSNNEKLMSLFSKYLPTPRAHVFQNVAIPPFIEKRENEQLVAIKKFEQDNQNNLPEALNAILRLQRLIRSRRRYQEERERIQLYCLEVKRQTLSHSAVTNILRDANTPYKPQKCSAGLAYKIIEASKRVKLFTTIRHLTATQSAPKIFDTLLFGRRSLIDNYLSFRPASLGKKDIDNGDFNTICFGPADIDDKCLLPNTTEITLDLTKLITNNKKRANRCIFFKQSDFEYYLERRRSVVIGEDSLTFSHTDPASTLKLFRNDKLTHSSALPHYYFMAYNLQKIHQILCLNFFRFIDTLKDANDHDDPSEAHRIYSLIDKLSHEELIQFLTAVGKQMSDTCEFNFYGAYLIDFDLILSIKSIGQDIHHAESAYTLNVPEFIAELQKGITALLSEVQQKMPYLLESTRFLEYCQAKVTHPMSLEALLQPFRRVELVSPK